MSAIILTRENFEEEVLNSKEPVLIDFWASWCHPCKMYSPIFEEVANEIGGVKVGKVNVDEERDLARKYMVMSIPTTVLIKDGKDVDRLIGVTPKEKVMEMVKRNL